MLNCRVQYKSTKNQMNFDITNKWLFENDKLINRMLKKQSSNLNENEKNNEKQKKCSQNQKLIDRNLNR